MKSNPKGRLRDDPQIAATSSGAFVLGNSSNFLQPLKSKVPNVASEFCKA